MFAPEGYWTWSEVCEAIPEWTRELIVAVNFPELASKIDNSNPWMADNILQKSLVKTRYAQNETEAQFALEVAELWVLANFLDTFEVVSCSPEGMKMRCPPIICAHGDALDWWQWPLYLEKFGKGETSGYLEYFRTGKFRISDAKARFWAIDYDKGLIRLKVNSARLFYTSSYGHNADLEDATSFMDEQVRRYIGWSVCWNPAEVPETTAEIFQEMGFHDIEWTHLSVDRSRVNDVPKTYANVLECVLAAYPEGKTGANWKQVEQKVGYSRRSIVRALKQNGRWADWASGGQDNA